ncbi:MAG TPA: DUF427 domain-containing protein [Ktedonobacterales bacterium]|nr:DUF427 domain-containing protein [Ktedonobacterales bacterium]
MRIQLGDTVIAETWRPLPLFETGLPTYYYIPHGDVRMDLMEPSDHVTQCAYKGQASHRTAKIGDDVYKHVAWTYHEPLALVAPIAGFVSFYNEKVTALYDGGELVTKPKTP